MVVDPETWDDFINHAVAVQQLSPSTVTATIRKLKYLERHGINLLADEKELKKQVYSHFAERIRKGTSGKTLNDYVKALNRWCKFRELDVKFKKYRESTPPRRIPTTEDIRRILDTCKGRNPIDKRDKTIIYFMCQTGLRIAEVCNLNLDDIDWEHEIITVIGKGDKTRIIPLPHRVLYGRTVPSLANYIKYWRLPTDKKAVFTTKNGRISTAYLRIIIKNRAIQAGLPWIHPHSFRHYYATNLLRAGVNIRIVQHILGHADIKTTGIYLHIVEDDLKKAVENERIEDPFKIRSVSRPRKNRGVLAKLYDKPSYSPASFSLRVYDMILPKPIDFWSCPTIGGKITCAN